MLFNLNNNFFLFKTDLKTGKGSCTGYGFIDKDAFYCGTGDNCNNWSNFKCSNPLNQTEIQCTSSDWQCKVSDLIFLLIKWRFG